MKCAYHSDVEAVLACSDCMKPLCGECAAAGGKCRVCAAMDAAGDIRQQDDARAEELAERDARRRKMATAKTAVLWLIVLVCLAATLWQLPAAKESLEPPKPLRSGTYHTDAVADACITNLWQISKSLQQREPVNAALVCPLTKAPYVTRNSNGLTVYACPNPNQHGLRSLAVSRRDPVPTVSR